VDFVKNGPKICVSGVGRSCLDRGIHFGRKQNNTMSDDTKSAENQPINAPLSHDADEVITKIQAARFLQVSKRTLDNHMRRGWIPFIKLPSGAVRFRRSQLIAFLETYQRVSVS